MPKKIKHFRGVQKQFLNIENPGSTSTSQKKLTASNKKLTLINDLEENLNDCMSDPAQRSLGYRIIDLKCLSEAMSRLHMCEEGKT